MTETRETSDGWRTMALELSDSEWSLIMQALQEKAEADKARTYSLSVAHEPRLKQQFERQAETALALRNKIEECY